MREKAIGTITVMMILISMLNTSFVVSAEENYSVNEPSNMDLNPLNAKETTHPTLQNRLDVSEKNSRSSYWNDKININETNEWRRYAYFDGNTTRLVIGVNQTNPSSLEEIEKLVIEENCKIVNTVSIQNEIIAVVVETPLTSLSALTTKIRQANLASYVEPNMKFQTQLVPNDPYWTIQWGPQKIQADWAWNATTGDPSILIAVVDTGIDWDHPDLAPNYVPLGYDWVNNDPNPMDDEGHGTHCAGIIAAVLNNNVGVAGLAQVRIMAEKGLDWMGMGYEDWLANAIIHAVTQGADIISMSWGGYFHSELIYQAISYAYNAGVLLVAAAGNDGTNMKSFPAAYDEVIAVVATDQYDGRPWWTNYGDWVELAAPGVEIFSTVWNNAYTYMSGTSMACPHVAGLAALIWSRYPNKPRDWVRLWLRFTADDLGDPSFDIYYGYGRINARKAVEQASLEHELLILDWTTPPYVTPGSSAIINATILNFGNNPETNVTIQLFANNTLVGFASISYIESGATATFSCLWSPILQGTYNLTMYLVPVPGENIIENNIVWKYIYVGYALKAAVLDSAGTDIGNIIATWQALNNNWQLFGNTMIYIDYSSLNKEDITYGDIAVTAADVLIISCASDQMYGWEFTDSEIEAIKRYILEGHGLIATAGTLYHSVPNNNKLAPLFGLKEDITWYAVPTDLLYLEDPSHPLFSRIPNPFIFQEVGTNIPSDGAWDTNELVDGKYVARGHFQESAIVVRRGLVYISPLLEIIPAYYHHHLQLLYNAITWSRYQKPQHDLAVYVDTPKHLQPGESALLNATVSNMGLNNETNVELYLLIDDTTVNSMTIPQLPIGASVKISYLWAPTVEKIYNVTAYSPPSPNDEIVSNNVDSAIVYVRFLRFVLWDDTKDNDGDSLTGNYMALYQLLRANGFIVDELTAGPINSGLLSTYDILVLIDPELDFLPCEIEDIQNWVAAGGALIIIPDAGYPSTLNTLMAPYGVQMTGRFGGYGTTMDILDHPITQGVNAIFVDLVREISVAAPSTCLAWIWELGERLAFLSITEGGEVVVISDSNIMEYALGMKDNTRLMLNIFNYIGAKPEHDLAITLKAPMFLEPNTSIQINATVTNRGLSNETNVRVFLLIDNIVVANITLNELQPSRSYKLHYLWTPTIERTYNVTAFVHPVHGEEYVANNIATKMVRVSVPVKVAVLGDYESQLTNLLWENGIMAYQRNWDVTTDINQYNCILINRPYDPGENIFQKLIEVADEHRVGMVFTSSWPGTQTSYGISLLEWYLGDPQGQDCTYGQGSVYYQVFQEHPIFEGWNIGDKIYIITSGDGDHAWFWGYSGKTIASIGAEATGLRGGGVAYKIRQRGNKHLLLAGLAPQYYANILHWTEEAKTILIRGVLWTSKPEPFYEHDVAVYNVTAFPSKVYVGQPVTINVTVANEGDTPENFTVRVYYEKLTSSTKSIASMPNEPHQANAMWIEPSFKDLTHYAVGQKFNVTAWLNLTEASYVWQICLIYNGTILNATGCGYTAGSQSQFFQGLPTVSVDPAFGRCLPSSPYYPWGSYVLFGETLLGAAERQRGYGSLCWIEFEIINKPQGPYTGYLLLDPEYTYVLEPEFLDFITIKLYNGVYGFEVSPTPPPMPPSLGLIGEQMVYLLPGENTTLTFLWNTTEMLHGNYTIKAFAVPVPLETDLDDNMFVDEIVELLGQHDVAVVSIKPYRSWVYQSLTLAFNVTIRNEGDLIENVTITLYYNITSEGIIAQEIVLGLYPGENRTITLVWNTTGIVPCRNYTITATATIPYPDRDPADNTLSDGTVKVRILGDINGDGKVDMKDIGNAARAFGETPERPRWNPDIDINEDGKIDMHDIARVAKHFGECA